MVDTETAQVWLRQLPAKGARHPLDSAKDPPPPSRNPVRVAGAEATTFPTADRFPNAQRAAARFLNSGHGWRSGVSRTGPVAEADVSAQGASPNGSSGAGNSQTIAALSSLATEGE
eukprot:CAMPEP_0171071836 /NCGR_PEP_ID=MMETSP0766_2-20121228/10529_1 /TAXON_ID=439317 /ORGANISM="Gambierdiscus australes, Strain CAWD 149" /LENGTH=115 /DNA_ID=CAMNT_0011528389 /DNA_START=257 /DNA_END=601 /DNA_ORIENTATION=-